MHLRRLPAALTAALLLPFGACTDGESNAEPSEPTTTATPSPTEPAGPTLPPQAQGDDEAAAKAFVRFYFELISDAMVTGETEPMRTHSTNKCRSCQELASHIEDVYQRGGSWRTKGWRAAGITRGNAPGQGHDFFMAVRMFPRTLMEGREVVTKSPATEVTMRMLVVPKGETWATARWTEIK